MKARELLRLVGVAVAAVTGWGIGVGFADLFSGSSLLWWPPFAFGGAVVGFIATPPLVLRPAERFVHKVMEAPITTIVAGVIGLLVGLVTAALVALPLSYLPSPAGSWLPLAVTIVLVYAGLAVVLSRERQVLHFLRLLPHQGAQAGSESVPSANGKIVMDTSAIIDGRIADITQTGFLHRTLIVPRFILEELQHIADSADSLRRTRGRRGLEILNKLRKERVIPLQVADDSVDAPEVDGKLIKLAESIHASILTTDFNLNQVAEIHGVQVLNVNELAQALRPVLLPGEEMGIRIVQEGKEAGQGVGFLDDGTMMVVEGGRRFVGLEIDVVVTRVLQTAGGRIIFANPRGG